MNGDKINYASDKMNYASDKMNYKIVLIGNTGVGKTSLVYSLTQNKYREDMSPTIGSAFNAKTINIDGKLVVLQIWDTAGQERYRAMTKTFYRESAGCLCVFDVTNQSSFSDIKIWLAEYREYNNYKINSCILVANKSEIDKSKWKISETEISTFAANNNCQCIYTSCLDGINIHETFELMARSILALNIKPNEVKRPVYSLETNENIRLERKDMRTQISHCACLPN